jgi:transcriptional regulator with XRE-family HTH domain
MKAKSKTNQALRDLRDTIERTQGEFAAMIGASKDAVASWEIGRNRLSETFARRIALATSVEEDALLRGRGPLFSRIPMEGRVPFTRERFDRYRQTYWGRSDEAAAREHLRLCTDALRLILHAAAHQRGEVRDRLPGVLDSFIQWCHHAREDFALGPEIEEQLRQRKSKVAVTHTYREWREMQKADPTVCRGFGFKDDPSKPENESLRLEMETIPLWAPGREMRGPRRAEG